MSCNALRDVRTFRSIREVCVGVKNFLKRLGVIVGGLIGFLGIRWLSGQPGGEAGQSPLFSDISIESLVDMHPFQTCSSQSSLNHHQHLAAKPKIRRSLLSIRVTAQPHLRQSYTPRVWRRLKKTRQEMTRRGKTCSSRSHDYHECGQSST